MGDKVSMEDTMGGTMRDKVETKQETKWETKWKSRCGQTETSGYKRDRSGKRWRNNREAMRRQ